MFLQKEKHTISLSYYCIYQKERSPVIRFSIKVLFLTVPKLFTPNNTKINQWQKTIGATFEQNPFKTADKLRKNIDAAEYKYVVLGFSLY